jgi:hypothetical protein
VIRYKNNSVKANTAAPAIRYIMAGLGVVELDADLLLPDDGLVITSGNDSVHMEGSKHYTDEALDVRSKSFANRSAKLSFVARLQTVLGRRYSVMLEHEGVPNEHFHVQVRRGMDAN